MRKTAKFSVLIMAFVLALTLCQGALFAASAETSELSGGETNEQINPGNGENAVTSYFTVSTALKTTSNSWTPVKMVNTADNYGAIDNQNLMYARSGDTNPMGAEKFRVEAHYGSTTTTLVPTNALNLPSTSLNTYATVLSLTFNNNVSLPSYCAYTSDTRKMNALTATLQHSSTTKVGTGRILYRVKNTGASSFSDWASCSLQVDNANYSRQLLINAAGIVEIVVIYEVKDTYGGNTTYHHFKAIYSFNMSGAVTG